jgi:hypothetical protein
MEEYRRSSDSSEAIPAIGFKSVTGVDIKISDRSRVIEDKGVRSHILVLVRSKLIRSVRELNGLKSSI